MFSSDLWSPPFASILASIGNGLDPTIDIFDHSTKKIPENILNILKRAS